MAANIQKHSPETSVAPAGGIPHPVASLRDEVDRLFDTFFAAPFGRGGWELDPFRRLGGIVRTAGELAPNVDVKEMDDKFEITAELPGMDEHDVAVTLRQGVLSISGEKKMERKEERTDFYLNERSYGRFVRTFRLPETADEDKVSADFSKGVLSITVPKRQEAKAQQKKIDVKAH